MAFLERLRRQAAHYIKRTEALAKGAQDGCIPLSWIAVPDLKTLLGARELPVFGNKADKVARLIGFAQSPAGESDAELQKLARLEEVSKQQGADWKQDHPGTTLKRWCANVKLRAKQQEGHEQNMSCRPQIVSGNPLSFYDPYHLFHNITNGLIFGSGGAGWQGKCRGVGFRPQRNNDYKYLLEWHSDTITCSTCFRLATPGE